jgi:hypothetical protein
MKKKKHEEPAWQAQAQESISEDTIDRAASM